MAKNNTMYAIAIDAIDGLAIGESRIIDTPSNLGYFRKYLSEISKREGKKFTTKVFGDKMHILRVKYSNIHSKEVE